jgi:hypothetical protein
MGNAVADALAAAAARYPPKVRPRPGEERDRNPSSPSWRSGAARSIAPSCFALRRPGAYRGEGLAIAGLVLGITATVLSAVGLIALLLSRPAER